MLNYAYELILLYMQTGQQMQAKAQGAAGAVKDSLSK